MILACHFLYLFVLVIYVCFFDEINYSQMGVEAVSREVEAIKLN